MADHQLLYVLFTSYDMSIHHDVNAVHDTLNVAVEAIKVRAGRVDVLYHTILYRTVLYSTVLCSIVLYCTLLYCTAL
jgi:hypothetical protein